MANPSKAIGTRAETNVVKYLRGQGLRAERKALAGSADEGDVRVTLEDGTELALEVKAGKQTKAYSRGQLREWQRQTTVEAENSGHPCILVITRYNHALKDAEVWVENKGYPVTWTMMYLDELQEYLEWNEMT